MIPEAGSTLTQSYRPVFPKTTYFCLPSPALAVTERILLNLSKVTSPLGWHQACAALGQGVLSLRATKNSSYNRNSLLRLPCSLLATHRDRLSNEEGRKNSTCSKLRYHQMGKKSKKYQRHFRNEFDSGIAIGNWKVHQYCFPQPKEDRRGNNGWTNRQPAWQTCSRSLLICRLSSLLWLDTRLNA